MTSTTLPHESKALSQTCVSISDLLTTSPLRLRRYSRRVNSFGVSSTGSSATVTSCVERQQRLRATAKQAADPGEELADREGLHQIIVGAGVEALDSILDVRAHGQHQHRRGEVLSSPAGDQLRA